MNMIGIVVKALYVTMTGWAVQAVPLPERPKGAIWEGQAARRREAPSTGWGWASSSPLSSLSDDLDERGKALYASGKVRDAREALLSAWTLKRSYDIAANLGTVELELGMNRDAAEHLGYSVRTFPSTGKKKNLAATKQQLDEARKQVGALAIKVTVDGAEVLVDGVPVGRAPLADEVFVEAGGRTVEAKASGYQVGKMVVQVAKGGAEVVNLALVALAAPVGPVASGGPIVPVGGSASASAPPPPPVGSGVPVVPPPVSRSVVPGVILGSVGIAALATGIGLMVDANSKNAAAQELSGTIRTAGHSCVSGAANFDARCTDLQSTAEKTDMHNRAGIGLLIGGSAAAMAAAVYVLWPVSTTTTAGSSRVSPSVSTGGAGLVWSGTF
jgi:hypothetical protein